MGDLEAKNPLHFAAGRTLDQVTALVEGAAKDKINSIDTMGAGSTPLHWAVANLDKEQGLAIIRYLVDNGADVNAQNTAGETPLHHAALRGDRRLVELLLELGAKTDVKSKTNQTPIDMAKGEAQKLFVERRLAAERKIDSLAVATLSVGKQLPQNLTYKISELLSGRPKNLFPGTGGRKKRKTRARKAKRRLTRRRK